MNRLCCMRTVFTALLLMTVCSHISAEDFCGYGHGEDVVVRRGGEIIFRFAVGVAHRPREYRRGLKHCATLPAGQGLLFVFPRSRQRYFWMKDTLIPLIIVFAGTDRRVIAVKHGEPGSKTLIPSGEKTMYVLEINRSDGGNIQPGDLLEF